MSLQTGSELGRTTEPLIDPATLDIIAYRLRGSKIGHEPMLLLTRDVRELGSLGIIVDSSDELVLEDDIIKIQQVSKLGFHLIGLPVKDTASRRLGKIYDYAVDVQTFTIKQIMVKQSIMRSLTSHELIINRSQIVEINNHELIVDTATTQEKVTPAAAQEGFTNPFRRTVPSQSPRSNETA